MNALRLSRAFSWSLAPWRYAAPRTPVEQAASDHFTSQEKNLRRMANAAFRRYGVLDPDRREEHVQNTIGLTWHRFRDNAMKTGTVNPQLLKSMLYYSVRQSHGGRSLPGLTTPNIDSPPPHFMGVHESIPHRPEGEGYGFGEGFAHREVAAREARESFLSTLKPHHRSIAEELMAGGAPSVIAARHGMSRPAFSMLRAHLADKYREHVGEEPGSEQFARFGVVFRFCRTID